MATLFGRYEYAGEIGRGATARVFAVHDLTQGSARRAVKVVRSDDAGRLVWEFSRLCQIEHPHVARVRELLRLDADAPSPFGLAAGSLLLVEDFAEGAPLSQRIAELADSSEQRLALAVRVGVALAEALSALHAISLVHGDVKPDNVLCDASGANLTLIDLGFARAPALGEVPRGTPLYMAPELFAGVCTPAADVYALGALLYDCIRGEAPSFASSRLELAFRARELSALDGLVNPAVARVIGGLLSHDPEQRPSDARAALAQLLPLAAQLGLREAAPLEYASGAHAPSRERQSERARMLPYTGEAREVERLAAALARDSLVLVRGPEGAGRSRLVREAIRELQRARASRGERVPTWVRSLSELAELRSVDAILWVQEGVDLGRVRRAAATAGMTLLSLRIVALAAPESELEGATAIDVGPLAAPDFQRLLARLIEPQNVRPTLIEAAHRASHGLAGRLCELVASLLLDGADLADPRSYAAARESELGVLSSAARELATMLAWWGRAFTPELGRALLGEERLVRARHELCAKALIDEGESTLVAPAARRLRRDTKSERAAIADRIVAAGGRPDDVFAALSAGDLEAARTRVHEQVHALRRAGRTDAACLLLREVSEYLPDERVLSSLSDAERARGRYDDALRALEPLSGEEIELARAELLRLSARASAARRVLVELSASERPAIALRARALRARLDFDAQDYARARAEAEAIEGAGDLEAEIRALEVVTLCDLYRGESARAPIEALVERASRAARTAPHGAGFLARAEARALALRAQVRNARGERTRALFDLRAALERTRALGELHEAATYSLNLGLLELESGNLGPAFETLHDAAQRLSRVVQPGGLVRVLFNFAAAALLVGDHDRATSVLDEAVRELASAPDEHARGFIAVLRSELALARGALDAAERALAPALRAPAANDALRSALHARAAQVALLREDRARAAEHLREAEASAEGGDPNARLEALTAAILWGVAQGDAERAERAVADGLTLSADGAERAAFSERVRFLLAAVEAGKRGESSSLRERTALLRSLLERALATLPRELRVKMRSVPAYARVFTAEASERAPAGEPSRFRALVRASRRLFGESAGARMLKSVAEIALELVQAERALVIGSSGSAELSVLARAELAPESERVSGFSRSVIERVALEGRSLMTIEARSDDRLDRADSVKALHVRSILCTELGGLSTRAFLYLDDRLRASAFGAEEQALIEDLAELAAHALRSREQLYRESRRARRAEQQQKRLTRELTLRESSLVRDAASAPLVGESPAFLRLLATARRVALSDAPVLITGESGTGKELVAQFVHAASARRARTFVAESCAALPDTLLESALFGHVRGAFTGAERARKGLFETADGGTLFLDEVGEMSAPLQSKLLRVLQEGELRPLGSERTRQVDVRVIAATRRDLTALVEEGSFREDLYYRLAVVTLELPALRERREDIPLLVGHFLEKHARGRSVRITPSALRALERKAWPGNVRELENELRRALALCDGEIDVEHVSSAARAAPSDAGATLDLHARTERLTRELVQEALARADGNVTRAAALLGLSRYGLQKILKRLALSAR